ncbi:hypothetical protein OF83DRAFT_1017396, partial [Amylostereum chailletii]
FSKRHHALLELLTSERAYASDLALIRDIHIPLALGQPAPFPITPPQSSSSSGRTVSTASDSSSSSSTMGPPMTREDTRTIFSNISELALFSDMFSERLEEALGAVLEGGEGDDRVGQVFIEMIPRMEPPYKAYITRHPMAVEHLNKLPQTPALATYLNHTRTLASSLTHAWDLPSLLIKPVQRLLKYSLLLHAIIEDTPDSHPDKANLRRAKEMMEEVSHSVNEGQRRREIIKDVLTNGKAGGEQTTVKKRSLNLALAASVSLGRGAKGKAPMTRAENEQAEQVAAMEREVRKCVEFIRAFAKDSVEWTKATKHLVESLRTWTISFGGVIGISPESKSEAFDAFFRLVNDQWPELCTDLDGIIREQLLPPLRVLLDSTSTPLCLLEAMHALEPQHHALLHHNIAKGRPSPSLLDCSQSYLGLRAQLCEDLPAFLLLLRRGIALAQQHLAKWQVQFYEDVRARWSELWEALRVDGEMNAGAQETVKVWQARFGEVEKELSGLAILRPTEKVLPRSRSQTNGSPTAVRALVATSMFNALEPVQSPSRRPSEPHSPPAYRGRSGTIGSRHSGGSSSSRRQQHPVARRPSEESLRSIRSAKSGHSSTKDKGTEDSLLQPPPARPRTGVSPRRQSMPAPLRKSSSHGRMLDSLSPKAAREQEEGLSKSHGDRGRANKSGFLDAMKPTIGRRSSSRKVRPPSDPVRSSSQPLSSPMAASFGPTSASAPHSLRPPTTPPAQSHQRVSAKWYTAQPKYVCQVMHACDPPEGVAYFGLPFFRLVPGDVYEVLKEAGHPSVHEDLPLYVDDGDDCLLLIRTEGGALGWALASFLYPVD